MRYDFCLLDHRTSSDVRSCAWVTPQNLYLCTSDQLAETGGERPHKMKSPQTPFLTTGLAKAWESLKSWGLGFRLHLQRHRRLVGAALAAKSTGSPRFTHERVNECDGDFSPTDGLTSCSQG